MDALIPLLLMLVLYLVPELLKRRKKTQKYEYPDIPDKVPQLPDRTPVEIKAKPSSVSVTDFSVEVPHPWVSSPKPSLAMPAPVNVPHTTEPASPWQGKLSPRIVQNGLIFAEIIQPPRAYRPIWRQQK